MSNQTKKETIPQTDLFNEKLQAFQSSRSAEYLRERYRPKTIEEKYSKVNTLSIVCSYLCQVISIISASSYLYSKILSSLNGFFYAEIIAVILTAIPLMAIEIFLREVAPVTIKGWVQFKKMGILNLAIIIGISIASVFMSFNGSFDVMQITSSPPTLPVADVESIEEIKIDFDTSIEDAKTEAKEFKKSQEWKGHLSHRNGKIYSDLLNNISILRAQKTKAISKAKAENKAAFIRNEAICKQIKDSHSKAIHKKGANLGYISIFAQLFFYLCLVGNELYCFSVLGQYAETGKEQEPEQIQSAKSTIGYKQQSEYKQAAQQKTEPKTTIEHKGKHYTESQVNNLIRNYQSRVAKAQEREDVELIKNRLKVLNYWFQRKEEFK